MHLPIRLALPVLILAAVRGQAERDHPGEVLERARANLQEMTRRLAKYACIETVERSYYEPPPQPLAAASCSRIQAARDRRTAPPKLEAADRLARTFLAAPDVRRFEDVAAHAVDGGAGLHQFVDPMTELEGNESAFFSLTHALNEGRDDSRAGPPGEMKARHRISVADGVVPAALCPADDWEEADAALVQP